MRVHDASSEVVTQLHRTVMKVTSVTYLVVGVVTCAVFASIDSTSQPWAWSVRLVTAALVAATGALGVALRDRAPRKLAQLLSMVPAAFILLPAVVLGVGVRAASLPAAVVIVVLAGLLISARAAMTWGAGLVLAFGALVAFESAGWIPGPTLATLPPPLVYFVGLSASVLAVALLVSSYTRAFHHALDQLKRAREHADAANRAKSRFLATMSHEIRTPLNGVLGMAQVLEAGQLSPEDQRESVLAILRTGRVLHAVLNDVLDLARAEAGQLAVHPTPTRPQHVLDDTVSLFLEVARGGGHELRRTWAEPEAVLLFDGVRARQMLSNLVSNALKFTPPGPVEVVVTYSDDTLRFEVKDLGAGLSAAQQELLFQPFQQLDVSATRATGGSGLGLSIVRKLAETMGGEAGVRANTPRGSVFWFELYAQRVSEPALARPAQPLLDGAGRRILVVEDNPVNRRVAELVLRRHRFEVDCVSNGREALALLATQRVDLVLMDCQMPEMDGYEATRQLRLREDGQRRLPIIALTASAFPEEREQCLDSGMDDLLLKPLDVRQLSEVLARWLA